MDDEEVRFLDANEYQGSSFEKISFKEIVLNHVRKIGTLSSVEFRGGYWEERSISTGVQNKETKIYIPDTREEYSNAIEFLLDLVYPHLDDKTLQKIETLEEEEQSLVKRYSIKYISNREDKNPQEAETWYTWKGGDAGRISYRDTRRKLMRKLFRVLTVFLKKVDYFNAGFIEDEA